MPCSSKPLCALCQRACPAGAYSQSSEYTAVHADEDHLTNGVDEHAHVHEHSASHSKAVQQAWMLVMSVPYVCFHNPFNA